MGVFERTGFEEFSLKNVVLLQKWKTFSAAQERQVQMWAHVKKDALSFMKQTQDELKDNFEKVIAVFCFTFDLCLSIFVEKYGASCILHPLFEKSVGEKRKRSGRGCGSLCQK